MSFQALNDLWTWKMDAKPLYKNQFYLIFYLFFYLHKPTLKEGFMSDLSSANAELNMPKNIKATPEFDVTMADIRHALNEEEPELDEAIYAFREDVDAGMPESVFTSTVEVETEVEVESVQPASAIAKKAKPKKNLRGFIASFVYTTFLCVVGTLLFLAFVVDLHLWSMFAEYLPTPVRTFISRFLWGY